MSREVLQSRFIELLSTQQKLIWGLCCMYCTLYEDREDLFQEIVLQLWKAYPSFKGQSKISTWIYRVALNTIFSGMRREKAQPKSQFFSEACLDIPNPEDSFPCDESTQMLYQAIQQLSEVDKAIIMLYLDEHTYEEIAAVLMMSKTNVSTRINRIKIKLEKLMKTHSI